ncbi:MAG: DCC1-like thiol-disulfide oxidoreductase family protein [Chitinophagales bacterium]|nr:DCC1-like thiol-disulfide oxidoreductase family protein [Chitinophagales bacterium]MDW8393955.1 DCC1-like thiol-disulfide oxidoreductase family protein [Chitinophagales bacterium]
MNVAGSHPVILFDGYCRFCSGVVQWILRRDRKKVFRFAPLQSQAARALSGGRSLLSDSFLLYESGKLYERSSAALRVVRHLPGLWPLLYGLIVVPKPLRDLVYNWIGRNRYRLFGKSEHCFSPLPADSDRFLNL